MFTDKSIKLQFLPKNNTKSTWKTASEFFPLYYAMLYVFKTVIPFCNGFGFIHWVTRCRSSIKSVIQGFLPGLALKIFLIMLPKILMTMSKMEGFTSLSGLDRRSASKYYLFVLVNVFLGSVITGTAFQQLQQFISQPSTE